MKHEKSLPRGSQRRAVAGFTLIEILVVLAVIAIIATMAVPAMNSVLKGSKMTNSSDDFQRDISRAHAVAMRENTPVEFRFYRYSDPEQPNSEEAYRAYQAVKRVYDPDDTQATIDIIPVFEPRLLPPGVIFSDESKYSTIIADLRDPADNIAQDNGDYDDSLPRVDSAEYKVFYFRPDGSTSLLQVDQTKQWFLTIHKENTGDTELPPDFVTFQVDAFNGQIRRYEKAL